MMIKKYDINDMGGGWFIGDFDPSVYRNKGFEVGIKYYSEGDRDPLHVHRVVTEVTVVVLGKIRMANTILSKGEIIVLEPNDESSFEALEDSALAVVKFPSLPDDKYILKAAR